MLNGIGGRTIEEARERMTYAEATSWGHYINRHGSLNAGRRIEASLAVLTAYLARKLGDRFTVHDFVTTAPADEDEGEATLDDVMNALRGARRNG